MDIPVDEQGDDAFGGRIVGTGLIADRIHPGLIDLDEIGSDVWTMSSVRIPSIAYKNVSVSGS